MTWPKKSDTMWFANKHCRPSNPVPPNISCSAHLPQVCQWQYWSLHHQGTHSVKNSCSDFNFNQCEIWLCSSPTLFSSFFPVCCPNSEENKLQLIFTNIWRAWDSSSTAGKVLPMRLVTWAANLSIPVTTKFSDRFDLRSLKASVDLVLTGFMGCCPQCSMAQKVISNAKALADLDPLNSSKSPAAFQALPRAQASMVAVRQTEDLGERRPSPSVFWSKWKSNEMRSKARSHCLPLLQQLMAAAKGMAFPGPNRSPISFIPFIPFISLDVKKWIASCQFELISQELITAPRRSAFGRSFCSIDDFAMEIASSQCCASQNPSHAQALWHIALQQKHKITALKNPNRSIQPKNATKHTAYLIIRFVPFRMRSLLHYN